MQVSLKATLVRLLREEPVHAVRRGDVGCGEGGGEEDEEEGKRRRRREEGGGRRGGGGEEEEEEGGRSVRKCHLTCAEEPTKKTPTQVHVLPLHIRSPHTPFRSSQGMKAVGKLVCVVGNNVDSVSDWPDLHAFIVDAIGSPDLGSFIHSQSSSTRASHSQNHSQKHCRSMLSPKTLAYGVFDCDFGFDSQEWVCSNVFTRSLVVSV